MRLDEFSTTALAAGFDTGELSAFLFLGFDLKPASAVVPEPARPWVPGGGKRKFWIDFPEYQRPGKPKKRKKKAKEPEKPARPVAPPPDPRRHYRAFLGHVAAIKASPAPVPRDLRPTVTQVKTAVAKARARKRDDEEVLILSSLS